MPIANWIAAKVLQIVNEASPMASQAATLESRFTADLEMDDMDLLELTMELETAFGIELRDEDLVRVATVSDVCVLITAAQTMADTARTEALTQPVFRRGPDAVVAEEPSSSEQQLDWVSMAWAAVTETAAPAALAVAAENAEFDGLLPLLALA